MFRHYIKIRFLITYLFRIQFSSPILYKTPFFQTQLSSLTLSHHYLHLPRHIAVRTCLLKTPEAFYSLDLPSTLLSYSSRQLYEYIYDAYVCRILRLPSNQNTVYDARMYDPSAVEEAESAKAAEEREKMGEIAEQGDAKLTTCRGLFAGEETDAVEHFIEDIELAIAVVLVVYGCLWVLRMCVPIM